jgi:AraC family transcriptional regulator
MRNTQIFNELSGYLFVRIHSCKEVRHNQQWIESKTHAHYDLWLVRSGTLSIRIGDTIHTANAGDAIFFYPHVPYTANTISPGCRFIYIVFDFGIGDQHRILDDFELCGILIGESIQREIKQLENAYDENIETSNQSGMRMKGYLTILLARIIELYGTGVYTGTMLMGYELHVHARNLSTLQPVFQYIHKSLHQQIHMSELATVACLSEKYFITYFKHALGLTPGQYIYQLKMNRARDYLNEKRYTVKEIANLLGYPDPYSFSKAFKKYYSVSPSQFE